MDHKKLNNKTYDIEQYREKFNLGDAIGYWCIDKHLNYHHPDCSKLKTLYFNQNYPQNNQSIEQITLFEIPSADAQFLMVSYGFSELYYDEASYADEISKFGFELVYRSHSMDDSDLNSVITIMQNLAQYVFRTQSALDKKQKINVDSLMYTMMNSNVTSIGFRLDPMLKKMGTPHGQVKFLEIIQVTK